MRLIQVKKKMRVIEILTGTNKILNVLTSNREL
jgi:hypothetical protein